MTARAWMNSLSTAGRAPVDLVTPARLRSMIVDQWDEARQAFVSRELFWDDASDTYVEAESDLERAR